MPWLHSCECINSPPLQSIYYYVLTHWGRVTHTYVSKLTIIASDNGWSPGRRQAIIWTSAGILLTEPLGTNFSEILIEIITFSFKKMHLKVSSVKLRPCCLGLNVLTFWLISQYSNRPVSQVPQCTCPISNDIWYVPISVLNGVFWDAGQAHRVICGIHPLWRLLKFTLSIQD